MERAVETTRSLMDQQQRRPEWVGSGRGIMIRVGIPDCGDWSPKIEFVLRIPTRDRRVGESDIEHREETCVLFK